MSKDEKEMLPITNLKCVALIDAEKGIEQVTRAALFDSSICVAIYASGSLILLDRIRPRPADGPWALRNFEKLRYLRSARLERAKEATLWHFATLIENQRLDV